MQKLFLLFLFLIILVQSLSAQVSIGNRGGVSLFKSAFGGSSEYVDDLRKNSMNTMGISIGMPIEIMLSDHFALQPEIGYTMKGRKYEGSFPGAEQTIRLNYMDVTLFAKGRIGTGKLQAEIILGPGMAYGLTVRMRDTYYLYQAYDQTSDFRDTPLALTEFYLAGGAGISYRIGVPRMFLNYRYVYGITDIFDGGSVLTDINGAFIARVKEYNRGSIISLGFLIPLSRSAWILAEEAQ